MTTLRPSALPALSVSPRFEAMKSSLAAMQGRDRHEVLENCFTAGGDLLELLEPAEMEGVQWARDYIQEVASREDAPLQNEVPLCVYRGQTQIMKGTADAICGDHIFDMKWRRRDYSAQMAAYALGLMQKRHTETVIVHVLYAASKSFDCIEILKHDAENLVFEIVDEVQNSATVCRTSEFCGWCKHAAECPILLAKVDVVENHLAEIKRIWSTDTAIGMGAALTLAYEVSDWADAVIGKAKDMLEAGLPVTGFELVERKGAREIAPENINIAFARLGLPVENFMNACKVSITKLENEVAKTRGIALSDAKREVNFALGPVIENKKNTKTLSKT